MKKTLLIALLLIPFLGFSQTTKPIEGFLGIKFGTTRAAVTAALIAKGGVIDKKESDAQVLVLNNIKLGNRKTAVMLVKFIDNQALEADFIFGAELEAQTIDYYNALVTDINGAYGKGSSNEKYQEPYSATDNDGFKIDAFKTGKVKFSTLWTADNKNTIEASIDENLAIVLAYQDDALVTKAVERTKEKNKSAY